MDEKALNTLYELAKGEGYTKDYDSFKTLMNSNQDAVNSMYKIAQNEGYTKSQEKFSTLVGYDTETDVLVEEGGEGEQLSEYIRKDPQTDTKPWWQVDRSKEEVVEEDIIKVEDVEKITEVPIKEEKEVKSQEEVRTEFKQNLDAFYKENKDEVDKWAKEKYGHTNEEDIKNAVKYDANSPWKETFFPSSSAKEKKLEKTRIPYKEWDAAENKYYHPSLGEYDESTKLQLGMNQISKYYTGLPYSKEAEKILSESMPLKEYLVSQGKGDINQRGEVLDSDNVSPSADGAAIWKSRIKTYEDESGKQLSLDPVTNKDYVEIASFLESDPRWSKQDIIPDEFKNQMSNFHVEQGSQDFKDALAAKGAVGDRFINHVKGKVNEWLGRKDVNLAKILQTERHEKEIEEDITDQIIKEAGIETTRTEEILGEEIVDPSSPEARWGAREFKGTKEVKISKEEYQKKVRAAKVNEIIHKQGRNFFNEYEDFTAELEDQIKVWREELKTTVDPGRKKTLENQIADWEKLSKESKQDLLGESGTRLLNPDTGEYLYYKQGEPKPSPLINLHGNKEIIDENAQKIASEFKGPNAKERLENATMKEYFGLMNLIKKAAGKTGDIGGERGWVAKGWNLVGGGNWDEQAKALMEIAKTGKLNPIINNLPGSHPLAGQIQDKLNKYIEFVRASELNIDPATSEELPEYLRLPGRLVDNITGIDYLNTGINMNINRDDASVMMAEYLEQDGIELPQSVVDRNEESILEVSGNVVMDVSPLIFQIMAVKKVPGYTQSMKAIDGIGRLLKGGKTASKSKLWNGIVNNVIGSSATHTSGMKEMLTLAGADKIGNVLYGQHEMDPMFGTVLGTNMSMWEAQTRNILAKRIPFLTPILRTISKSKFASKTLGGTLQAGTATGFMDIASAATAYKNYLIDNDQEALAAELENIGSLKHNVGTFLGMKVLGIKGNDLYDALVKDVTNMRMPETRAASKMLDIDKGASFEAIDAQRQFKENELLQNPKYKDQQVDGVPKAGSELNKKISELNSASETLNDYNDVLFAKQIAAAEAKKGGQYQTWKNDLFVTSNKLKGDQKLDGRDLEFLANNNPIVIADAMGINAKNVKGKAYLDLLKKQATDIISFVDEPIFLEDGTVISGIHKGPIRKKVIESFQDLKETTQRIEALKNKIKNDPFTKGLLEPKLKSLETKRKEELESINANVRKYKTEQEMDFEADFKFAKESAEVFSKITGKEVKVNRVNSAVEFGKQFPGKEKTDALFDPITNTLNVNVERSLEIGQTGSSTHELLHYIFKNSFKDAKGNITQEGRTLIDEWKKTLPAKQRELIEERVSENYKGDQTMDQYYEEYLTAFSDGMRTGKINLSSTGVQKLQSTLAPVLNKLGWQKVDVTTPEGITNLLKSLDRSAKKGKLEDKLKKFVKEEHAPEVEVKEEVKVEKEVEVEEPTISKSDIKEEIVDVKEKEVIKPKEVKLEKSNVLEKVEKEEQGLLDDIENVKQQVRKRTFFGKTKKRPYTEKEQDWLNTLEEKLTEIREHKRKIIEEPGYAKELEAKIKGEPKKEIEKEKVKVEKEKVKPKKYTSAENLIKDLKVVDKKAINKIKAYEAASIGGFELRGINRNTETGARTADIIAGGYKTTVPLGKAPKAPTKKAVKPELQIQESRSRDLKDEKKELIDRQLKLGKDKMSTPEAQANAARIRAINKELGVKPVSKRIPKTAEERSAETQEVYETKIKDLTSKEEVDTAISDMLKPDNSNPTSVSELFDKIIYDAINKKAPWVKDPMEKWVLAKELIYDTEHKAGGRGLKSIIEKYHKRKSFVEEVDGKESFVMFDKEGNKKLSQEQIKKLEKKYNAKRGTESFIKQAEKAGFKGKQNLTKTVMHLLKERVPEIYERSKIELGAEITELKETEPAPPPKDMEPAEVRRSSMRRNEAVDFTESKIETLEVEMENYLASKLKVLTGTRGKEFEQALGKDLRTFVRDNITSLIKDGMPTSKVEYIKYLKEVYPEFAKLSKPKIEDGKVVEGDPYIFVRANWGQGFFYEPAGYTTSGTKKRIVTKPGKSQPTQWKWKTPTETQFVDFMLRRGEFTKEKGWKNSPGNLKTKLADIIAETIAKDIVPRIIEKAERGENNLFENLPNSTVEALRKDVYRDAIGKELVRPMDLKFSKSKDLIKEIDKKSIEDKIRDITDITFVDAKDIGQDLIAFAAYDRGKFNEWLVSHVKGKSEQWIKENPEFNEIFGKAGLREMQERMMEGDVLADKHLLPGLTRQVEAGKLDIKYKDKDIDYGKILKELKPMTGTKDGKKYIDLTELKEFKEHARQLLEFFPENAIELMGKERIKHLIGESLKDAALGDYRHKPKKEIFDKEGNKKLSEKQVKELEKKYNAERDTKSFIKQAKKAGFKLKTVKGTGKLKEHYPLKEGKLSDKPIDLSIWEKGKTDPKIAKSKEFKEIEEIFDSILNDPNIKIGGEAGDIYKEVKWDALISEGTLRGRLGKVWAELTQSARAKKARELYPEADSKAKKEAYLALGKGLEKFLHSSKNTKEFESRLKYLTRLFKHQTNLVKGFRQLVPTFALYMPKGKQVLGKGKERAKLEHLKSSLEQSLQTLSAIAKGEFSTKGRSLLSDYSGIFGKESMLDILDIIGGKTNISGLARVTADLSELKNYYTAESGFRESIYDKLIRETASKAKIRPEDLNALKQKFTADGLIKWLADPSKSNELQLKQPLENKSNYKRIFESNSKDLPFEGKSDKSSSISDQLEKMIKADKALAEGRKYDKEVKKARVFDFDDTIARSKSNVLYEMPNGKKGKLNAEEFARDGESLLEMGAKFDFSEFNRVIEGKKGPLFDLFKKMKEAAGDRDMFILTARAPESAKAIHQFLKELGVDIPIENITGLADASPNAKAQWMLSKFSEGYNDFYFADDALKNVDAVKTVLDQLDVKSKVQQARYSKSKDLDGEFNRILEATTGIEWFKEFSEAKGQVLGARKGKGKFLLPPSAEDFLGLLYPTLSKGKIGENQMKWYEKNLLTPYSRAMQNLSSERLQMMSDFKALKKQLKVPKELKKKNNTGFTNEQAVRTWLWNKGGKEVPGLSKTDLRELIEVVENNSRLKAFAEQMGMLTKGDGYVEPGKDWLAGTITTDLVSLLNTTKRKKYLAEWEQNIDIVFSKKNLNKLESVYGKKYREAVENSITRMKSGKNRTSTGNRLSDGVLNYINNAQGTIMFLNMRSAVLQTISAANFINLGFNNPVNAGRAFANQKQYWKDFVELMNSDYLVDRRNGLKLNISESEIADAAKGSANKAKAAVSYILEKGYLPTKFADSFAIASGGATWYRNRIRNLVKKEGFSEVEAKKKAFEEFRDISEKSQQSSDPSKISQQQSSDLGRVVLQFVNTPMQYVRIQKRAFQDLKNRRGDWKSNLSKIVYYGIMQNLWFNGMQQGLFALGFGDDEIDEKEEKKLYDTTNGMLDSILRGSGMGGMTVSVLKNLIIDIYERSGRSRPEYSDAWIKLLEFSPAIKSKMSKFRSAGWAFDSKKRRKEVFDKGFSLDNPAYESLAKVFEAVTNVPTGRLYQKYKNVSTAIEDDTEVWQSVAMFLGWPEWDIKPESGRSSKTKKTKSKVIIL